MPIHIVSAIDLRNFGGYTLRIGDLNADGAPDLLLVQSVHGTREITCLTAIDIFGQVLWQHGKPDAANGKIYSDLPVQIHDFDGDGVNEVLWVEQAEYAEPIITHGFVRERAARYAGEARVRVLDATTGREKRVFSIPAPADDTLLFADLTGRGRRQDLIVKDRYWNIWGVSHEGRVLWHWNGPTGHAPTVGDVDGDGRDEVFCGYALIDHDGTPLFTKPSKPGGDGGEHADAVVIHGMPDGSRRLIYGNGGLHCLAPDGSELWQASLSEAQHVTAGRFRGDSAFQVAALNRGKKRTDDDVATLYMFDADGRELWSKVGPPGSWASISTAIDWMGPLAFTSWLVGRTGPGRPTLIYDGWGDVLDELPVTGSLKSDPPMQTIALPANVWGDARDEVIVFHPRGLCIYANSRPLAEPRHYNSTHYLG